MIDRYYQEELAHLRELAADFSAAHPALAPMLRGPSSDPDVERLLEGVAFQNALLRRKLDDDFPEVIHDLVRLSCPQYLQPIPAATIVAFSPKATLAKGQIPKGTQLASIPVEGTRCLFRTCSEVALHPLEVADAAFVQSPSGAAAITVTLALTGISLSDWDVDSLRFFLADEYPRAAEIYRLLRRHLTQVVIDPEEPGRGVALPADCLHPTGFGAEEALVPAPASAFPGHRLLREWFAMPHRFLFLDLAGWERWTERGRGSRFTVRFELASVADPLPKVRRESFALFCAAAVNLFPHDADPFILDHRKERYLVRPSGLPPLHAQVFSVDKVTGFARGTSRHRSYRPFRHVRLDPHAEPAYHEEVSESPLLDGFDLHLSFPYSDAAPDLEVETISVALTCTNAGLPELLRIGDVCVPTPSSPESATFRNVTPVTPGGTPRLGKNLLWRLISHLALNRSSLASAEKLRALLALHLVEDVGESRLAAARRQIDGITALEAVPVDRLVRGLPMRGTECVARIDGARFAGSGDLFLFGSVLDHYLATHAALNAFTRLVICDSAREETVEFPPRLGERLLV